MSGDSSCHPGESRDPGLKLQEKDWAPAFAGATNVAGTLEIAVGMFTDAGFEAPDVEARALMAGFLHCSSTALLLHADEFLDGEEAAAFQRLVERRLRREPVAYILGRKNFMGFEFEVNPSVLIPRPETELLVEDVLMEVRDRGLASPRILDMGTGSGCIALSLARFLPEAQITAVDISDAALKTAERNARKLGADINGNVSFLRSDLFSELGPMRKGGFDMILANPPYIASPDLSSLEPDLSYEPRLALDGGKDGLNVLRRIVRESRAFLKPNGLLVLEIGHDQGDQVRDLLDSSGFENILILKDTSGLDRIAKGTKRGSV